MNCVVLEGFWQVIQNLLLQKGEISDCSYSVAWSVFLTRGSLLLSGSFFVCMDQDSIVILGNSQFTTCVHTLICGDLHLLGGTYFESAPAVCLLLDGI